MNGAALAAVTVDHVTKVFSSGTEALSPVSLRVEMGSFASLVGPSGCGKSTLLRMVAGLTDPTSGTISRSWPSGPEGIGFVFQDPTLMPWATVAANVELPLRLANPGISTAELAMRVTGALQLVGLQGFTGAFPRELSGGMRMRVSIARAIVTRPRILLMDEPFAALDEFTRFQLNEDLLALWQENRWTVLFVTHSIREAVFLSERIVVMSPRPGRIVADMPVAFTVPRTAALRDTHAFTDTCAQVGAAFGGGMAVP
ncbi:MAG: ABC transporter ATP-binding protein [Rhodospirillaceae bacterium]|nr:MAG: ABC transporter ATP-binding protein [Rhodospirillaceae bacterium]